MNSGESDAGSAGPIRHAPNQTMMGPVMNNLRPLKMREMQTRRADRARSLSVAVTMGLAVLLALSSVAVLCAPQIASSNPSESSTKGPGLRLISLNPSLTAIILRLGAGETLVGVDDVSAELLREAAPLPRVGGLFDPSLESILGLRPDRVLLVAGIDQRSHGERLERLGVAVEVFENERLDQVLENIERLGRLLGREAAAAERIASILGMRRAVAGAVAGRSHPATLAVVDRSPLYLVGGETFLDEMLEAVGARNLARAMGIGYPRGSIEWVIDAAPELLLDMTPGSEDSRAFWARWPSLPAVAKDRVLTLEASRISMPGPELDRALRELAIAVHGSGIESAIDHALERQLGGPGDAMREGHE
jgi:ABC-type Fe3+-hydroxamate transport system substrate-binding protein